MRGVKGTGWTRKGRRASWLAALGLRCAFYQCGRTRRGLAILRHLPSRDTMITFPYLTTAAQTILLPSYDNEGQHCIGHAPAASDRHDRPTEEMDAD